MDQLTLRGSPEEYPTVYIALDTVHHARRPPATFGYFKPSTAALTCVSKAFHKKQRTHYLSIASIFDSRVF
jgi:hypothetical protein